MNRSLREGMAEILTLQRLKLQPSLYKCLATGAGHDFRMQNRD
jgi:hypothetical protein